MLCFKSLEISSDLLRKWAVSVFFPAQKHKQIVAPCRLLISVKQITTQSLGHRRIEINGAKGSMGF
jgi:hypothetical protein